MVPNLEALHQTVGACQWPEKKLFGPLRRHPEEQKVFFQARL